MTSSPPGVEEYTVKVGNYEGKKGQKNATSFFSFCFLRRRKINSDQEQEHKKIRLLLAMSIDPLRFNLCKKNKNTGDKMEIIQQRIDVLNWGQDKYEIKTYTNGQITGNTKYNKTNTTKR